MNDAVEIVEVGPRDGLQSQPKLLETATKLEFIARLVGAGIRRMEVVSFVSPKRVPQMADAEAVVQGLPRRGDVTFIGLVLNRKGLERAQKCGMKEVNCVVSASDEFGLRNQGADIARTLEAARGIAAGARAAHIASGVTISAAFGCPFEGEIPVARVVDLAGSLAETGFGEIALADTIGAAGPSDVAAMFRAVRAVTGNIRLRGHFHNTRNTGVANAYAAIQEGVRVLDASCGGVGGCPFAPAATGNVATEDILYMVNRMGMETGIDISAVMATARWLGEKLETAMPSMVTRAGLFPPQGPGYHAAGQRS
ncbi:MAG: hydroxymethylglutaryl-CoA lyase [Gammaproteobacteria bacterium]|nr:hydroxymethylglutaryl-CoA lyase [Gammaproteobacteria bacterium]